MKRALLVLALLLTAAAARAQAPDGLAPADVPEPLRPWIDWVMQAEPSRACPLLAGYSRRSCVYAGPLTLDVGPDAARFLQGFEIFGDGAWVALPGDAALRPQDVRANGQPIAVATLPAPQVWLAKGSHAIDGTLRFDPRPATLPVPATTAIVSLTLDGVPVSLPARDESGRVWLEARSAAPAPEDALDVQVFRRVVDDVPLGLATHFLVRVAGRPREVVLGPIHPAGFVPLSIESALPARLETDGRLRLQVRPGTHVVRVDARHEGPVDALAPAAPAEGSWPAEEVWVFQAMPALRIVAVEGVAAIDPNQTELPAAWRALPAYVLRGGDTLRLAERRRGDPDPTERLALSRTWWLDFDGTGLTFRDEIQGRLRKTSRLEMPAPAQLGRVAIGGRDWFLTQLEDGGAAGVEAPPGALALEADGRIEEADTAELSVVGWSQDFDQVGATLYVPPGWRLVHVFGADEAFPSWIGAWTLLDFFLVLVTAAAATQLFGLAGGALALAALVLTWVEPGSPNLVWIGVLAAEALVRVLGARRIAASARVLRGIAWLALAVHAIPYAVDELRRGLHLAYVPGEAAYARALQQMGGRAEPTSGAEYASDVMQGESVGDEEEIAVPAPAPTSPEAVVVEGVQREAFGKRRDSQRPADLRALDPDARIPTGPGVPTWSWQEVQLAWSGPVDAEQSIRLLLVSPFWNRLFSFARVLLVAAFVAMLLRRAARPATASPPAPAVPATALAALLLAFLAAPAARAEFPPDALLEELRERLSKEPACKPSCASIARLGVEVRDDRLRLRLEAHAAVASAVPLPAGSPDAEGFGVESVVVDSRASDSLQRAGDGTLWLALAPGVHEVLVEARVAPDAERVDLSFALPPGSVAVDAPGWSVEGLAGQGGAIGALTLRRDATPGATAAAPSFGAVPPPVFARVERTLVLGVAWQVEARVVRLSALGQAVALDVPLLEGEALATEGIPVQDGRARVALAADQSELAWTSTLTPRDSIALRAPESVAWVEAWQLQVEPIWHVDAEGIPPIAVAEDDPAPLRSWRPWPGESLTLAVRRPRGVGGSTLTIDRARIEVQPGRRSRDASLDLELRSTQGARHTITLPEGAELRAVRIDGLEQPLRAEGRELSLPIRPGAQDVRVEWRSAEPMSWRIAAPDVALGAPAVNLIGIVRMPEDRWILALGGPRLGPYVLFWSVLGVLALVAWGLSRVPGVPLRFHHWLLLGVGLTQVPVWMGALVAGWLLALAWRRARGAALEPGAFDAVQIALVAGTALALWALFAAIRQGLLGAPEMQIGGNGSNAGHLAWYQDRSAGEVPAARVYSVPLFVYRAAMLAWASWLASALLRWLRWGWESFSEGGLWRPLARRGKPPASR